MGNEDNRVRVGLVSLAAWLPGVIAYAMLLRVRHGERFDGNDARAVLIFSSIAFAIAVALVYMPLFGLVRQRMRVFGRYSYSPPSRSLAQCFRLHWSLRLWAVASPMLSLTNYSYCLCSSLYPELHSLSVMAPC